MEADPTLEQLEQITDYFSNDHKLGEGTYGKVYRGVYKNGEEVVAKLLYTDRLGLDHEQFQKEFFNLTRLKHPNITRLVGYCYRIWNKHIECEGENISARKTTRALFFEYLHNGSLQNYLSDEYDGIDWHTRYKIIKGICEGLRYLHEEFEEPIYHLNLKPDNILLDRNMVPKLADFGLSNFIGEEQTRITQSYLGTNGYLPPEYVQRNMVSTEVDIFSLGVVIMKIVAGTRACSKCAELSPQGFTDVVRQNWRRRLSAKMSSSSSLKSYCQQVKRCIEIALKCMENDKHKRPNIGDIIAKLNETETLMDKSKNNPGPLIGKDIPSREVRIYSFQDLKRITNNFCVKRMIGEGVFGAVFRGEQGILQGGQVIAVKRFNHDARLPQRLFENEVVLKIMEHKNIVRLDGYCYETREEPFRSNMTQKYICRDVTERFLCYEFFPNGSLDDILFGTRRQGLDWKARCNIIQGICQGVHYLHEACSSAPIVHMDLNPANIFLDNDMVPKIGDFGLLKKITRAQTMNVVGSVGYMAPEYANSGIITTKTDIYSLGILIIEIVTGEKCTSNRTDHSGRSFVQKVQKNWTEDFYILSKYQSLEECSIQKIKSLVKLGLRCVEERPEVRPTIGQIIRFLEYKFINTEDTAHDKVMKVSFQLVKDITNNFSKEHLIVDKGFGAVYKGATLDGDVMAVKRFEENTGRSEQHFTGEKQFKSEVMNLMSLEHENVLQLKGYCDDIAQVVVFNKKEQKHVYEEVAEMFLFYEFLPRSLGNVLYDKSDQLDWPDRYRIINGICQGLRYLHDKYETGVVVHLAIKPGNILLDAGMVPKIWPFALARLGQNSNCTRPFDQMKQDMYDLGILILEIVTGKKCPTKEDEISVRSFINYAQENWTDDRHIASEYPSQRAASGFIQQVKNCIKIAMRCVDGDPHQRPTASQVITMLRKEFTDHPQHKRPRADDVSRPTGTIAKKIRKQLSFGPK